MKINQFHLQVDSSISIEYLEHLISIITKNSKHRIPSLPKAIFPSDTTKLSLPNIKAVIFDIYGTILHSVAGDIHTISEATTQMFEIKEFNIRIKPTDIHSLLKKAIVSKHEEIKKYTPIKYPEIDIVEIWQKISANINYFKKPLSPKKAALCAIYYELYNNPSWTMPYAMEVLESLQKNNYVLGIVSNAQFYTPLTLQALFGTQYTKWKNIQFPIQVWSYCLKEAKPSLHLFDEMIHQVHKLGIKTDEILYIGNDKKNDIYPAQTRGVHTLLFAGDNASYRPRLDDSIVTTIEPSALICDLRQVLEILNIKY